MFIKKRKLIMSLRTDDAISVGKRVATKLSNWEMDADATKLLASVEKLSSANGASRKNAVVKQQNELFRMLKNNVGDLAKILSHKNDESESFGFEIYEQTLKGKSGRGMQSYIGAVNSFLDGLGDTEFDDPVASYISTIRILLSRFEKKIDEKEEMRLEIHSRKQCKKLKRELCELMCVIFSKLEVQDSDNGTEYVKAINELLLYSKLAYKYHLTIHKEDSEDDSEG